MIRIDIALLVGIYTLFSVIGIFVIWAVLGYRKMKSVSGRQKDTEHIWKCSICFHTYIDSLHEEISACPLCGSYNKRGAGLQE